MLVHLFRLNAERQFDMALEDDVIHIESSLGIAQEGQAFFLTTPLETPLYDQQGSGWTWQLRDGDVVLAQSGSLPEGVLLNAPMNASGYFHAPGGALVRGTARAISLSGLNIKPILNVAGSPAEIESEAEEFSQIAVISLGALCAVLALTGWLQVRIGLRPLRRLVGQLQGMLEGEPPPEVHGWPVEITPLVRQLHALQEHNHALIARGQRQAADLAHTLKTPLAVTQSIAEDAPPEIQEELLAQVRRMTVAIERILSRTRSIGGRGRRTEVKGITDDLLLALSRLLEQRSLQVENNIDPALVFFGASSDLEEMLGNLLENAAKWAKTRIVISARPAKTGITIMVDDDGPGVPESQREAIVQRGQRLDETIPGQGLGLSITAEIIELYNGEIKIEQSVVGGLCAALELPGRT